MKENPEAVLDEAFVERFAPQVFNGINKLCSWLADLKNWKFYSRQTLFTKIWDKKNLLWLILNHEFDKTVDNYKQILKL